MVKSSPKLTTARKRIEELTLSLRRSRAELSAARRLAGGERSRGEHLAKKLRKSAGIVDELEKELREVETQMKVLSRGILSAQEEERKRISRELHDVIAQLLTAINLRLAKLDLDVAKDTLSVRKNIQSTQRLVEKSVGVVHRFARELRPAALDDLGLIPTLRSLVGEVSKETGIRMSATFFSGIEKLTDTKRTVLYRVAQEALINIRKHAKASQVELSIRQHPGFVRMTISDDGQGFDVDKTFPFKTTACLGLLGMRERVEMVGGSFRVDSADGKGCTLQADIPFAPRRKADTAL